MTKCIICGELGERHHIVYKNQGGIDIPLNYVYLCDVHHRGEEGPHKNRILDLELKKNMQQRLLNILVEDYYNLEEVAKLIQINPMQIKLIASEIQKYKLGYKKIDIIKRIMGRRIY